MGRPVRYRLPYTDGRKGVVYVLRRSVVGDGVGTGV